KRVPDQLAYTGDSGVSVDAVIEKIPDGYPVANVASSVLASVRDLPGAAETVAMRSIEISGLDGREIVFTFTTPRNAGLRRVIWVTATRPRAFYFIFTSPVARAASDDATFKAIVESVVIDDLGVRTLAFERARNSAKLGAAPVRI